MEFRPQLTERLYLGGNREKQVFQFQIFQLQFQWHLAIFPSYSCLIGFETGMRFPLGKIKKDYEFIFRK